LAQFRADRRLFAAACFIGRVDSGPQIIVFGAAGTAMPASWCRRRSPIPPSERATGGKPMSDLHDDVFAISPDIRYVAAAHGQQVQMRSRPDLHNASSSDSDLYEELLVNPTLLTLATQRGNIDCGGLRYLIVGYGHFHQLVIPRPSGHVSIAFELRANPADYLQAILGVIAHHGQPAA
jgi:hypothetical protein